MNTRELRVHLPFATAFLLLAAAGAAGLVLLVTQADNARDAALQNLQQEAALAHAKLALAGALARTASAREALRGFVVDDAGVPGLLDALEATAKAVQLTVETTSVEAKGNALELSLTVTGSFARVHHFLSLLERFPYRSRLVRADLAYSSVKHLWTGNFTIEMNAYLSTL